MRVRLLCLAVVSWHCLQAQGSPRQVLGSSKSRRLPYNCAHGGLTFHHPPNTAAAYQAALLAGADCMEIDAALTSDHVLVALHDRDLQAMLGRPASVRDLAWSTSQHMRWPSGDPVLTVLEAMATIQQSVEVLIIDVKASPGSLRVQAAVFLDTALICGLEPSSEEEAYLAAIQQLPLDKKTVVWGKSDSLLQSVSQFDQRAMTGFTVMRAPGTAFEDHSRFTKAQVAAVYHGMLNASLVQLLQAQRQLVFAWTVDEAAEMQRLIHTSVDGIVTNDPALLHALMQRLPV